MIERPHYSARIQKALARSPIVAMLGPRQCGKTTLARMIAEQTDSAYFDMESPVDVRKLENPELLLKDMSGLVVIDEIQTRPELFPVLRVIVDQPENKCHFLILGSASPHLIKNVSESLAGRVEFVDLAGFDLDEVGHKEWRSLWIRGGFPRSWLADSEEDSVAWRESFIRTFLQRDIPALDIRVSAMTLRKFWTMLAHFHGETWNASRLSASLGLSDKTVRSYLDILTNTYMVRQLQPWFVNIGKRQVKSPKIYLRDTGILHNLLSLNDFDAVSGHPQVGHSWEGFALEQVLRLLQPPEAYYWSTYSNAELDLLLFLNGKPYGVEFKFNEAPTKTKSMDIAIDTLELEKLLIVYPGVETWPINEKITVCPVGRAAGLLTE